MKIQQHDGMVVDAAVVAAGLRQVSVRWAFGQRSRTIDLSGRLLPILSKVGEFRSRMESNYEKWSWFIIS